jgi:hypothetical protein
VAFPAGQWAMGGTMMRWHDGIKKGNDGDETARGNTRRQAAALQVRSSNVSAAAVCVTEGNDAWDGWPLKGARFYEPVLEILLNIYIPARLPSSCRKRSPYDRSIVWLLCFLNHLLTYLLTHSLVHCHVHSLTHSLQGEISGYLISDPTVTDIAFDNFNCSTS